MNERKPHHKRQPSKRLPKRPFHRKRKNKIAEQTQGNGTALPIESSIDSPIDSSMAGSESADSQEVSVNKPIPKRRNFRSRTTPAGEHRPILLPEILELMQPIAGKTVVDATLGFAGHSEAILSQLGENGMLIGCDLDPTHENVIRTRLEKVGNPFRIHLGCNFAGLANVIAESGLSTVDIILVDLGVSSMQIDDSSRGFSFMRTGPLDMRMNKTRGKSAAEVLQSASLEELGELFAKYGDEPQAFEIAAAIVQERSIRPITSTTQLTKLIQSVAPATIDYSPLPGMPSPRQQRLRPVARVFQSLRIHVNREIDNIQALLRVAPYLLNPGGKLMMISFHSGEDRLVKTHLKEGLRQGIYEKISEEIVRAAPQERFENPRSRSAKLRWGIRSQQL